MHKMKAFFICLAIIVQVFPLFRCNLTCHEGTSVCTHESKCIPQQLICDGRTDCSDGSDEEGCDSVSNINFKEIFNNSLLEPQWFLKTVFEAFHLAEESKSPCGNCTCIGLFAACHKKGLQSIPTFEAYPKPIIALDLTENALNYIRKHEFQSLLSLGGILLDDVQLKEIENGAFSNNDNLNLLSLRKNQLKALPTDWFSSTNSLKELVLADNLIEKLEEGNFQKFGNLRFLNLKNNRIKNLRKACFQNLVSLEKLDLHGNSITHIDNDVFVSTKQMRILMLAENSLKKKKLSLKVSQPATSLRFISFNDFFLCSAAPKAIVYQAKVDKSYSVKRLLNNYLLQKSVWIMGMLAFGGNILVMLRRSRMKELNPINLIYILNLCFSDFLMGFYLIIIALSDLYYKGVHFIKLADWLMNVLCQLSGVVNASHSVSSVLILSLITWDQFVSITQPLTDRQKHLNRHINKATLMLICIWIVSSVFALIQLLPGKYFGDKFYTSNNVCFGLYVEDPYGDGWMHLATIFMFLNAMGPIFIIFVYTKMLSMFKLSDVGLRRTQNRRDPMFALRVAIIIGIKCLCWITVIVIKSMALSGVRMPETVNTWLGIFVLPMSSAINPIVHIVTTLKFMKHTFGGSGQHSQNLALDNFDLLSSLPGRV